MEKLVLDHNGISSSELIGLPPISSLTTLWLNNNYIDDLEVVLSHLSKCFPNLSFLSMLVNPSCPDPYTSPTPASEQQYHRFRCFVLHYLPNLRYLDSTPVTKAEREEGKHHGRHYRIARPKISNLHSEPAMHRAPRIVTDTPSIGIEVGDHLGLPSQNFVPKSGAFINRSRIRYDGKNSEGNRFIRNNDL